MGSSRATAAVIGWIGAASSIAGQATGVSSDDVQFTTCGEANCSTTASRSLTSILYERPSVLDFGAVRCDDAKGGTGVCPDATAAFERALGNTSTGAIYVPKGTFRIDGTVTLGPMQHLVMEGGTLTRTNHTSNTDPVVRLLQSAKMTGQGSVTSRLASPRGVINIGPTSLHDGYNCEFNLLDGIYVSGPGPTAADGTKLDEHWNTSTGSIGICLDSAQPFATKGHYGGCCYQNVVRGGHIGGVSIGVYLGDEANGNQVKDIMMNQIGKYGYFLVNASENYVSGGFISGGPVNMTVIKSIDSMFNNFHSVSAEPGPGSQYFDFKGKPGLSMWNTVIGHDNTYDLGMECWSNKDNYAAGHAGVGCPGPQTTDQGFSYIDAPFGIHIGNFDNGTKMDMTQILQVEGPGYIKALTHGLPVRREGHPHGNRPVEAVDESPAVLTSHGGSAHTVRISNLGLVADTRGPGAAYYEITISGHAEPPVEGGPPTTYTARYLVTPWRSSSKAGLAVETLVQSSSVLLLDTSDEAAAVEVVLADPGSNGLAREVIVDVRRVGRTCTAAVVTLEENKLV